MHTLKITSNTPQEPLEGSVSSLIPNPNGSQEHRDATTKGMLLVTWSNEGPQEKAGRKIKTEPASSPETTVKADDCATVPGAEGAWRIQFPKPAVPAFWMPLISDMVADILEPSLLKAAVQNMLVKIGDAGHLDWVPKKRLTDSEPNYCRVELPLEIKVQAIALVRQFSNATQEDAEMIVAAVALRLIRKDFARAMRRKAREEIKRLNESLRQLRPAK